MQTTQTVQIDTTDSSDLTTVEEIQTFDNELYYMDEHVQNIKDYDIKNFNYILFEEDLDNMTKQEFLEFIKKHEFLLNDCLLDISLEEVDDTYRAKLTFLKNNIRFLMNTLPYNYLKQYLEDYEISGLHDALDTLNKDLVNELLNKIDESNKHFVNFELLMGNVEEGITNDKKRAKFNEMLNLLGSSMDNKIDLLQYHKSILLNTGNDSLQELCKLYVKNDLSNIL